MSRARVVLIVAAAIVAGCATGDGSGRSLSWPFGKASGPRDSTVAATPTPTPAPVAPAGGVADAPLFVIRADAFAREGMPLAARDLYERVIREYPQDPASAGALYGLGRLQADSAGPLRDYRMAYLTFGRVLAEHPRSRWETESRLWRGILNELVARDDEAQRLRVQLQKLRRIEVDLDKPR